MARWTRTIEVEVRMEHPHRPTEGLDYHELLFLGETTRRDSLGRRHPHGWRVWAVLRCNNTACPAQAVVAMDRLVEALEL